ncbi:hypothetical protein [Endozoicomonas sp. ONNA2]|uniref:hypothetical protein n=1 Tax=Endozoicomonas sp. ONNA2 TaxID=2828741 RepID=UPI002148FAEC|nr:hypothetical protein [Endozoicomonas sp. ONNA2]
MNIGNMATGLAGAGLMAAVTVNTDAGNMAKWQARAVMAIAGSVGTTLGLLQCLNEGPNVSTKTLATLATNASVLVYSYLQPLTDNNSMSGEIKCIPQFLADGTLVGRKCQPIHHNRF